LKLVGDSPLIVHKWSEKVKREMADKMAETVTRAGARAPRDPQAEYRDSLYELSPGVYGFPAIGLKAAAVRACTSVAGIAMTEARAAFHIDGEFVKITGTPSMREDMVKVGMGAADIRYRGEFREWSITFTVKFNKGVLTLEQIINLFNIAGFGVGIGEWRPQKNGSMGMFHVEAA
jgi:hypothetical protein